MKSFDQMADDFVAERAAAVLPYVLTDLERQCLEMGYLRGLSVGIQYCTDALQEKGKNRWLGSGGGKTSGVE